MRKLKFTLIFVCATALFFSTASIALPEKEHGDAPEGSQVPAYPSMGIMGSFPTCVNTGPAGWVEHDNWGAWFGPGFDLEFEGNAGNCPTFTPNMYDQDECFADGDAGLLIPPSYTITGNVGAEAITPCVASLTGAIGQICQTAVWGTNIDIRVHNTMPNQTPGYVNVLVDWDQGGSWGGSSTCPPQTTVYEHVLVDWLVPNGYDGPLSGLGPPPFTIGPNSGYVWVRFTISEQQVGSGWEGTGSFEDGESEDYLLEVLSGTQTQTWDFGDAPDPAYPTLLASNGASHITGSSVYLGAAVDSEADGQPTAAADGDDTDAGGDDEDGVVFNSPLTPGQATSITVTANAAGKLDAWADFNIDGDWADATEQIFTNQSLAAGANALNFNVPAGATAGGTYIRFRFSTQGYLLYNGGPASDGEVEDYAVTIEQEDPPVDYLFEFSLDIGSDIELSDPQADVDEAADPGDIYWWQSAPIVPPGRDGFKDDAAIFVGVDPLPDPPDALLISTVPVGGGDENDYVNYFDLDGHDQLENTLVGVIEGQLIEPIPQYSDACIYEPAYLAISYDDDGAPGWPASPALDVPTTVPSSASFTYGTTGGKDEIIAVDIIVGAGPPFTVHTTHGIADEATVHASMAPNPDLGEADDDDVDSLDIVPNEQTCPVLLFSPDHEAHLGLDPGGIYERRLAPLGPVKIVDEETHLGIADNPITTGITEDADIDAFEFVWMDDSFNGPGLDLAVLFSVDEDDPLTPTVDESGGLIPNNIYYSFMTGYSQLFTQSPLEINDNDIDAITVWNATLKKYPPCWDFPTQCHGDANGDSTVALLDFYALRDSWNHSYPAANYDPCIDVNRDGSVGLVDFYAIRDNWNKSVSSDCVPGDINGVYP